MDEQKPVVLSADDLLGRAISLSLHMPSDDIGMVAVNKVLEQGGPLTSQQTCFGVIACLLNLLVNCQEEPQGSSDVNQ